MATKKLNEQDIKLVIKKPDDNQKGFVIAFVLRKDENEKQAQNAETKSQANTEQTAKRTYRFVATSEIVDRDGDIMRVKGAILDNFLKNPVILFAHKQDTKPVGKAVNIEVANDRIYVDIEFADTEKAKEVEYLVKEGYLNAVSIGFLPKAVVYRDDFNIIQDLDPEFYARHQADLEKANRVIWEWELLEVSVVPVPANPDAIAVFKAYGIDKAYEIKKEFVEKNGKIVEVKELIPIDLSDYEVKAVPNKHPANMKYDDKSPWDKTIAIKTLRKWASRDGSGRKETIDWNKYKMGFGWYDAKKPNEFTSYKFPHHWVKDGDFYCVWSGVRTAMAFLIRLHSTGRLTIPEQDARKLYKHLVKHYKEFGKEPPEFKQMSILEAMEYNEEFGKIFLEDATTEELVEITKSLIKAKNELEKAKEELNNYKKQIEALEKELKELKLQIKERQVDNNQTQVSQNKELEKQNDTQKQIEKHIQDAISSGIILSDGRIITSKEQLESLAKSVSEIIKSIID